MMLDEWHLISLVWLKERHMYVFPTDVQEKQPGSIYAAAQTGTQYMCDICVMYVFCTWISSERCV